MDRQRITTTIRPGFTLVELVLVLVIVAVVSAIALPKFSQASARHQLNSAADRVASDLELAQTRARAASLDVSLTFSTSEHHYDFSSAVGDATHVELDESPYGVKILRAKFGATNVASFNGFGIPKISGYVILQKGSETRAVILYSNGEVRRWD